MYSQRPEDNRFSNGSYRNPQPQNQNTYNPNPAFSPNLQPLSYGNQMNASSNPNNQPPYQNPNQAPYQNQNINQIPYQNPNINSAPYQNPNQYLGTYQPNNKLSEQEHYEAQPELSLQAKARNDFVKKVYLLLTLQLLITAVIGYFGFNSPTFKQTFANTGVVIALSVALLALSIVIACCTSFFRKYALPIFIIFTLLMSVMVAIAICAYQSKVVLTAAGITLLLAAALTLYAWNTTSDITDGGPYLMVFGLVMLIFGIVAIFWRDPIVQLIYSCLSAFLFAIYLVYDTERIIGTKKFSASLDDSYLAAIHLYIDIVELFLNLLKIISYFSRN